MKSLIAALALSLPACATIEPQDSEQAPDDVCGAVSFFDLLGRTRSDSLVAEVAQRSGEQRVRWIGPSDVVTMDYNLHRLNIHLDAAGKVTHLACG